MPQAFRFFMSRDYQVFVVPPVFWQTKENMHITLRVRSARNRYSSYKTLTCQQWIGQSHGVLLHNHRVISLMSWYFLLLNKVKRNLSFYSNYPVKWPHTTALLQLLLMEELPFINQYHNYHKELINEYNFNNTKFCSTAIYWVVWFPYGLFSLVKIICKQADDTH